MQTFHVSRQGVQVIASNTDEDHWDEVDDIFLFHMSQGTLHESLTVVFVIFHLYICTFDPAQCRNDGADEMVELLTVQNRNKRESDPNINISNSTHGTCGDQVTPPAPSL
jgi:hypothetical protein